MALVPSGALTWNGATWRIARLALVGGHHPNLTGLSCGSAGDCVAIGSYQLTPRSRPRPFFEHWNGRAWHISRIPSP